MAKRRGNGEGSITRRKDGRWQGCATVGYNTETGKPKKTYFYGKTRKEVQEKLNEALGKLQAGTYVEPTKITVAEWMTTWVNDYMKPSLRPTTWESYNTHVQKHIKPALGHLKLNQLQTNHLQRLYNEKLVSGRADGKEGGLSPRTVRYIHTIIHAALDQALKERLININPADATKLPQMHKKEMQTLDTDGVTAFLKETKGSRDYVAYLLELATGLRRGELLALRWKDIDLEENTLSVTQNLVRIKGGLIFQEPKTKLSKRTINLPKNIIKELKAHKAAQAKEKLKLGEAYNDMGLVFCNEEGRPVDPRSFTKRFEKVAQRLVEQGFPKITFHGLRHTFATLSLQEKISAREIQETLGHHSPAFTMSVYSHVTNKMKKEATDKIGNLIASCME